MVRKLFSLLILTLFLISLIAVTADAKSRVRDARSDKLSDYGFMYERKAALIGADKTASSDKLSGQQTLASDGDGNTPGALVAHTWYDYQQNSSAGRQIDWRYPRPQIHMTYTQIFAAGGRRYVSYNIYDPVTGNWPKMSDIGCPVSPPQGVAEGRAGYSNIDVRPDGAAIVTGHHRESDDDLAPFQTAVYVDQTAVAGIYCGFGVGSHAPNDLAEFAAIEPYPAEYCWPKVEYHINGTDTAIYALSVESPNDANLESAMVLFRNVGSNLQGTWEAHVIDTVFFSLHDITSSRTSRKVTVVYLDRTMENIQGDNDVYYLTSDDMGATWNHANKVNVTNYQTDEAGYRAWLEVSCLYDSNDHLHIIWNANVYTGDGNAPTTRRCRLFHWADHTDIISTIQNAEWDPTGVCGVGGLNVLNLAKFTISECNNRMYVIWLQYGDPENGDSTDCADPNLVAATTNANADIYLSVSTTLNGALWDAPRNLTNTKTPGCDSTAGNECSNESWPFMSRYGMDVTQFGALDWAAASDAFTVDPSTTPPYTGDHYLDVMYVNDVIPGPAEETGGTGTTPNYNVPIKWFRLPCVDPVIEARIVISPNEIVYPEYVQHGESAVYDMHIENAGNADLNITDIYLERDTYSGSNWLAVDQTSMLVPSGAPGNIDTLKVTLNNDGVINNPGTVVNLIGRVGLEWQRQVGLDTAFINIDFYVADTIVGVVWDTISTNYIDLVVSSNGNMGNSNIGFVNMDFFGTALECDDSASYRDGITDTIPGDASVYLGNGSPVVLHAEIVGSDTNVTASWAIFTDGFDSPNGFKPVTGEAAGGVKLTKPTVFEDAAYDCFHTGSFVTVDSALVVEKTYYAPKADVSYIIQMMRVLSYDGASHGGLIIGEAFDWDLPSDTGSENSAGTDPVSDLIYLMGGEWSDPQGDSLECTDNDSRAGGAARIGYYTQAEYNVDNGVLHADPVWGGYTEINQDYVWPAGSFIPLELYRNIIDNEGLNAQASSVVEDQHMVLTYFNNYTIGATDTLIIWSVMATVPPTIAKDAASDLIAQVTAARTWFDDNRADLKITFSGCCEGIRGDANCSGGDPDISDITRLIDYLYLSHAALCCLEEADANGSGGEPDISDITKLIDNLYLSHQPLPNCP
ncbi:MAG: hypothetical protein ACOYVF_08805 [Candidatus Zixiibacteriota bacterium]